MLLNNTSQETIQVLVQFLSQNKLAGVGMKAKLFTHEGLPETLEQLDAMEVDVSNEAVEARVQEMLKEFDAEESAQEEVKEEITEEVTEEVKETEKKE